MQNFGVHYVSYVPYKQIFRGALRPLCAKNVGVLYLTSVLKVLACPYVPYMLKK